MASRHVLNAFWGYRLELGGVRMMMCSNCSYYDYLAALVSVEARQDKRIRGAGLGWNAQPHDSDAWLDEAV